MVRTQAVRSFALLVALALLVAAMIGASRMTAGPDGARAAIACPDMICQAVVF